MSVALDLADIQGNILTAYGKLGFPKGRFITLHIDAPAAGRAFVTALLPRITTALRWRSIRARISTGAHEVQRPPVAINIAFSWLGLYALDVPTRTLRGMPDEFIDGMASRAPILGDDFPNYGSPPDWDQVWPANAGRGGAENSVHILISLNAQMNPDGSPVKELDLVTAEIEALCDKVKGVRVLPGHNRPGRTPARYQELSAIMKPGADGAVIPLPTEHFGFTDAIGDPVFAGQYPNDPQLRAEVGHGAFDGAGNWRPLATGEFLLGYPDEEQEIAGAAMPLSFSRNGTFMAYRKLHENVVTFRSFMASAARQYGAVSGIDNEGDAVALLMAKFAGRWLDGAPLSRAPTIEEWRQFNKDFPAVSPTADPAGYYKRDQALSLFTYGDDGDGVKCPITSHLRRVNTRDSMGPTATAGSVLTNRRRILRRGLPYGDSTSDGVTDSDEHGIVMLAVCASLVRQFEFVQQQWINYGLDARAGNDTCPLVGNHSAGKSGPPAKFIIPSDPKSGRPPFIVEGLPQFVETRGGEYFFVPSMTALRMLGMGVIDPT
jgi:Dyp-type peroxidase family